MLRGSSRYATDLNTPNPINQNLLYPYITQFVWYETSGKILAGPCLYYGERILES